ncbi:MAG TPA: sigma 54-interacting transcriptional regulator, partial [Polyangia bacterium]|nr:sigma 54-interacting transcriptional regulator [Polyangia bacterium]
MIEPLALALKTAASAHTPVLIQAEPGSGAIAVAELIHARSAPAPTGPLVVVRCGGTPESALQIELFGPSSNGSPAREGADGGTATAVGRAIGGTLFIDEIALLGLPTQAALAALSDKRHQSTADAGFRLIATTSVDLRQRAGWRVFRQDLLELLGVIGIRLPPLRERPDELLALAERFIAARAREMGVPVPVLSPEARDKLLHHRFPGNADELRAVIER